MSRKVISKEKIDEDLLLELAGNISPTKEKIQENHVPIIEKQERDTAKYESIFLNPIVGRRSAAIYIRKEIKDLLGQIILRVQRDNLTVAAYLENIITDHLKKYKNDILSLDKGKKKLEDLL